MARLPRLYMEGCPQHIIQRGNNRCACFFTDADYAFYLQKLKESAEKYAVSIHAYILMTNHVHLLATPSTKEGASRLMQSLGRSYVRYINITYHRSGTLWEGRFKSSLVDSTHYFLTLSRYIELNPVRADMVTDPADYPWSSYRSNGMGIDIELLTPHPLYIALGRSKKARMINYRALFQTKLTKKLLSEITSCTEKEWVIGSEEFRRKIEYAHKRQAMRSPWGGDRKSKAFQENQEL